MLTKVMMQEIQDLKLRGYTKSQIPGYYEAQGIKPPSAPTISKYYDMDVVPDNPGEKLEKPKAFDVEPFRSVIIEVLRNNEKNKNLCISSVYDVLEEKFIENGEFTADEAKMGYVGAFAAQLRPLSQGQRHCCRSPEESADLR